MGTRIEWGLRLLLLAAILTPWHAHSQGTADPIESRLVNQAQASQTQNQNFLEAVKALIEARSNEKTEADAKLKWVLDNWVKKEN